MNGRSIAKILFCLVLLAAPAVVGALPSAWLWSLLTASAAIAVYAIVFKSQRATKLTAALISLAVTLAACDLLLRLDPELVDVPRSLIQKWPKLPLVIRYLPNLDYSGYRFNDLSRMAGIKAWREAKWVRVVTDEAGFRNERQDDKRSLDVILLGDSFGAGAVGHEDTWTGILARDFELACYNLSSPASGPWQQYINLCSEHHRLQTTGEAILIWQLFTGNDLDDPYGTLEMVQLPWCTPARAWLQRALEIREQSPLRQLLQWKPASHDVVARDFLNDRKLLFYQPYINAGARSPEEVRSHAHYLPLQATLAAVRRLADARGWRLAIVLVPAKEEVYQWARQETTPWTTGPDASGFGRVLTELCSDQGLPLLDLKPHLVQESRRLYEESGALLYWYDDTHMNAVGNRFCTHLIYSELLRRASPLHASDTAH